jgi:hypothetical protein
MHPVPLRRLRHRRILAQRLKRNLRLERRRLRIEIVKRSDDMKGFVVLPRRWVVECSSWYLI